MLTMIKGNFKIKKHFHREDCLKSGLKPKFTSTRGSSERLTGLADKMMYKQ